MEFENASLLSVANASDTSKDDGTKYLLAVSTTGSGIYQAVEDYTPKQEGEMSLIEGDLITEVRPLGQSWAIGRNYRGFIGTFPTKTVKLVKDGSAISRLRLPRIPVGSQSEIRGEGSSKEANVESEQIVAGQSEDVPGDKSKSSNIFEVPFKKLHDAEQSPNKTETKLFTKPSMLVKPRRGKMGRFISSSKTMGDLRSPIVSTKKRSKHNTISPSSNKLSRKCHSKTTIESDPYYSTPSTGCNFHCHCGRSDSGNEKFIDADKVIVPFDGYYENVLGQDCCPKTNLTLSPHPNRCAPMYTKVNKSHSNERWDGELSRIDSPAAEPIVYTEPFLRHRAGSEAPEKKDRANFSNPLPPVPTPKSRMSQSRIFCALFCSIVIGGAIFAWTYYVLECDIVKASVITGSSTLFLFIVFVASRMVRCLFSISLSSLPTTSGRIFILIVIWTTLGRGPLQDICNNLVVSLDSMSCLVEQSSNKTISLMRPYDLIMEKVNKTMTQVEAAARDVNFGLLPLDQGLERVETRLSDGRQQLLGTEETCQHQFKRAYNECLNGLAQSLNQCQQVMTALAMVYRSAREILDKIDPNKWTLNVTSDFQRAKRQTHRGIEETNIQDICQPLTEQSVCKSFVYTLDVCRPASWAGEAIQEAINFTQAAMKRLHRSLQFHVTSLPYWSARESATDASTKLKVTVMDGYATNFKYIDLVLLILMKISPLCIVIVIASAYDYVRKYVVDVKFDNIYLDKKLNMIDNIRCQNGREPRLLPLRRHEQKYIEKGLCNPICNNSGRFNGLLIVAIHLLLVLITYVISCKLYYLLSSISKEGRRAQDLDGYVSIDLVVTGEGMIVDLLEIFLNGLHPGKIFGRNSMDSTHCLPSPRAPSYVTVIVLSVLFLILLTSIIFKKQIFAWRNGITGYFYTEQHQTRLSWLYDHMSHRRSKYPGVLLSDVMFNYRLNSSIRKMSRFHSCLYRNNQACDRQRRCLLCACSKGYLTKLCPTDRCEGAYCLTCLNDMAQICPLCWVKYAPEVNIN